jgi:HSP20 family molecular chaperone IbpA
MDLNKKQKFDNVISCAYSNLQENVSMVSPGEYFTPTVGDIINDQIYVGDNPNGTSWAPISIQPYNTPYVPSPNWGGVAGTGGSAGGGLGGYGKKTSTAIDNIDYEDTEIIIRDDSGEIKVKSKLKDLSRRLEEIEKNLPNKVDKDLVNGKLPYNIKIDLDKTLYYEFAVAGYSKNQIKILPSKEGLEIKLFESTSEDLLEDDEYLGELYEYINKGIKLGNQTEYIFVDHSKYDINNIESQLKNGILYLKIRYLPKKEIKIEEQEWE